jgi:dihydrolipoamide dehydrogenase
MIAIIGAGTAGLTARREVARVTEDYVLIDGGPMGTTCARVGCMPSKVILQVAHDFHRRVHFETMGIRGGEHLSVDRKAVMDHVRQLRDRFTSGVLRSHHDFEEKIIRKKARFLDQHTLDLEGERLIFNKAIIATGSSPIIPAAWEKFRSHLVTTDDFFEMQELPESMAVIGLGVIGLELGQALFELGIETTLIGREGNYGGASSPIINQEIKKSLFSSMNVILGDAELVSISDEGKLVIAINDQQVHVDRALIAIGRKPNLVGLKLEKIGLSGIPKIDPTTMAIQDFPHLYLAGDANGIRPLLHEASDQGFIAGQAAARHDPVCFHSRTPMAITFTEPNIASSGLRFQDLKEQNIDFITGSSSLVNQGRAVAQLRNKGLIEVYACPKSARLLGAEFFSPSAEHMAHLLAWSITDQKTVFDLLTQPFYHPVVEEGLRTALRDVASKIKADERRLELHRCAQVLPGNNM